MQASFLTSDVASSRFKLNWVGMQNMFWSKVLFLVYARLSFGAAGLVLHPHSLLAQLLNRCNDQLAYYNTELILIN